MTTRNIFNTTADLNRSDVHRTLSLNFVNNNKLSPLITFTRNSQATYFDKNGILQTAGINQPVFEWDPITGQCLGLRIWDAVTNSIRNNTTAGAVAGTPGTLPTNWGTFFPISGVTRTVVGTGTENGIDYLDLRLAGTPSAAGSYFLQFDNNTSAVASIGQTWTTSVFLKLASGSLAGINAVLVSTSNRNSLGDVIAAGSTSVTVTSNLRRFSNTFTNPGANTAYEIGLIELQLSGAAIDITIRIGLPQLQQSATVGPVIKTSGITASSTADVASITGAAFAGIWNQPAGTVYSDIKTLSPVLPALTRFSRAWQAMGATMNDRIEQSYYSGGQANFINIGGVVQAEWYPVYFAENGVRAALAFAGNDIAGASNGVITGSDTNATLPSVTQLIIGRDGVGGNYLNGYIRELAVFNKRLPNSILQAMTE